MDYVDFKWKNSTKQSDRLPAALQGDYINIDERSFEDLISQMAEYARSVKFYEEGNLKNCVSDWRNFFEDIYQYEDKEKGIKQGLKIAELEQLQEEGNIKPHMALMLSFLKMYQLQQQNLNKITERHLDYYYKEMLGFTPKQGTTGKVIVFPSLNKKDEEVVIPKGTLFDAGKDDNGNSVYYASVNELTVSKAKVTEAKTIDEDGTIKQLMNDDVSPVADVKPSAIVENRYGFAITGPHLEQLDTDWRIYNLKVDKNCVVEYTTDEGWEKMNINIYSTGSYWSFSSNKNRLISNYNPSIHGEGFETDYPLIRILLPDNDNSALKIADVSSVVIYVNDSENLTIENANGKVENKIGAQPFGAMGKSGDFFTITPPEGAILKEVYDRIQPVHIEKWKRTFRTYKPMEGNAGSPDINKGDAISCTYQLENDAYDQQKAAISIALKLAEYAKNGGQGLEDFKKKDVGSNQSVINDYVIPPIPNFWDKCHIDYEFRLTDGFDVIPFTPFGVSPAIQIGKTASYASIYNQTERNQNKGTEGLYFAIDKLKGDCVLSVYFGIDDADLVKPAGVLPKWFYKGNDKWYRTDILADSTNGLSHSGIVTFRLNVSKKEEDLLWLKAENSPVKETKGNVENDVLYSYLTSVKEIRTHGLELEFSDASKSQPLVGESLPAGSISKLVKNIAGIKAIEQPFDGDKGKENETEEKFRCRVSERLRHKGKAINKWDYERLVLEKFPQVAEAKCMPSYGYYEGLDGLQYKPGSVVLLVSPEIECQTGEDSLRPKMGEKLLSEIQQYMDAVKPPFVELVVESLQYEALLVEASVVLNEGYNNEEYYKEQINNELVKFIAPWSDSSVGVTMSNELTLGDILMKIESMDCVEAVRLLKVKLVDKSTNKFNRSHYQSNVLNIETDDMSEVITPYVKSSVLTSEMKHVIRIVKE